MKRPELKRLLSDIASQPKWRKSGEDNGYSAQKAADYYDGYQLTPKVRAAMQALSMPDIVENLIKRPVNSMLGHEAQRRRDWLVKADDDDSQEVAEGLNQKLNKALRLAEANSVCSEAYASMIKTGIGWVHVRRNDDPRGYQYKIEHIHRDEIYWDMRSRKQDLDDCRWMARRRYLDIDEAKAILPAKYHQLVTMLATGWQDPGRWEIVDGQADVEARLGEWSSHTGSLDALMDSQRQRVALYEVYYRSFETAVVLIAPDGSYAGEFNDKDVKQLIAVMAGQLKVKKLPVKKMRRCWYLGPHFLTDEVSPYPHDVFPYIPFFGYREDGLNVPYGIVRDMMDSQDAFNNCNARIHHIMNQVQIIKEEGATVDDDDTVIHEVNRKDGLINLNAGKRFELVRYWDELHRVREQRAEHKAMIQEVSGVLDAYTGEGSASQSGKAIQSLAELTAVTLAEINDNYEYGRKKVAELILSYLVADAGDREEQVAIPEDLHQSKRTIVLNGSSPESGQVNSVAQAKYRVDLQPIQASQGYRQQVHERMAKMYEYSPDAIKISLFPMIVDSSDMPRKAEFLKKWNQEQGIVTDPEQQQAQQAAAQQAQQAEQEMVAQERQAEIQLKQAQAIERQSEAELNQANAAHRIAEIEVLREQQQAEEADAKQAVMQQARQAIAKAELAAL